MDSTLHTRAKQLFLEASEKPPEERADFLDEHCHGDEALRREVHSLLDHFDEATDRPVNEQASDPGPIAGYKLIRKVGEGGMGEVWEAEQHHPLRRRLALKIMKRGMDSDQLLARFESERQTLAMMDHPGIATIFDAGISETGRSYFAMEFVEGVPITEHCNEHALDVRQRLELFARVCRAVQHAHDRQVVHRDLKPANILVTIIDGEPSPKIIDFGIARAAYGRSVDGPPLTVAGQLLGTPEYMSPEQAEPGDTDVDHRSDVYSLGVVLRELLAGLDAPRGGADRIVRKALEFEPSRRYDTAGDLAADIDRHLAGERVLASRLGETVRRRLWLAVTLVVLAVAAGFVAMRFAMRSPVGDEAETVRRSVAVLPFVNLSDDPADDYFSEGLSTELRDSLAQHAGLRVAAHTSSLALEGAEDVSRIGEMLGVDVVLAGSVLRTADRVRVTAQAIDATSGSHLWSRTFERDLEDLYTLQTDIAGSVTDALDVTGAGYRARDRQPTDAGVYDLHLRGRHLLRDRDPRRIEQAVELFTQAVALDPGYAPAYTGLADGYLLLTRYGDLPMDEARARAREALEHALQLDNQLADAHASLGLFHIDRDPSAAETAFRRAIALNDNHATAHLLLGQVLASRGQDDEADEEYRRALELDPLNPQCHDWPAISLMARGHYDDAIELFRKKLVIDPRSAETYRLMALFARSYGKLEDALHWASQAVALGPSAALNLNELAMAYGRLGYTDRALEVAERAYRQAPNNDWVLVVKSGLYLGAWRIDDHIAFTDDLLASSPVPETDPLSQAARIRLVLAAQSEIARGDLGRASRFLERAVGDPPSPILEVAFDLPALVSLAYVYQELGRADDAKRMMRLADESIEEMPGWLFPRLVVPDSIAAIQLLRGNERGALATLAQAERDGWNNRAALAHAPIWDPLRDEAAFEQLLQKMAATLDRARGRIEANEPGLVEATPSE